MNGLVHIITSDRKADGDPYVSYYVSEPGLLPDGSGQYAGGFDGNISSAITFDNIILAHLDRKRLAKIYADISAKIRVKTMTTKEMFKARLGG